jgi:hypothetical protein
LNAKNKRGQTALAALKALGAGGRGRPPAQADAGGADATGEYVRVVARPTTVALLRKLGAKE